MLPKHVIKNIIALCIGLAIAVTMMLGFILLFAKSGIILNQNYNGNFLSYKEDHMVGYTLLPNQSTVRSDDSGDFTVSTNNTGFRDSTYDPLNIEPMTYKIMALGDSFTFGGRVRAPYPELIETRLHSKIAIHVFNLGTPGYGTINQYGVLEKYGNDIGPDIVITAFFLGNDFHDNLIPLSNIKVINGYLVYNIITWSGKTYILSDNELNTYVHVAKTKELTPYSLAQLIRVDKFGDHMTFIERTVRQLGINFPAVRTIIDMTKPKLSINSILTLGIANPAYYGVTKEEERVTRDYLTKIKDKCQELKAELILVIIPEYIKNYDNGERRTILKNLCRETGITNVIDLFPIFEADMPKYYMESDVHFSQAGHDATADAITAYILDHHLLRPEGKGR